MIVFLGHSSADRLTGGFLKFLEPLTVEAVSVFFVLSGFVIGFVASERETKAENYIVARAARIYSVALPALVLTFSFDAIGRVLAPTLYDRSWGYLWDHRVWQFVSGAFFINRFWGMNVPQGSDLAYWSLGCEVWYYFVFGLMLFLKGWRRSVAVPLTLLAVGPLTTLLFPLWLLGLGTYRLCKSAIVGKQTGKILYLGSLIVWIVYEATVPWHHRLNRIVPYPLHRPELIQDYIVGVLFATHLVGFHFMSNSMDFISTRRGKAIRWLAGGSFSLYLLHQPIEQLLAATSNEAPASLVRRGLIIGGTLIIVYLLAELTERRKKPWSAGFYALVRVVNPGSN